MKKTQFTVLAFVLVLFVGASSAFAGEKFMGLFWWESHWKNQDFNPYYDNGIDPHNSQWTDSNWTPADWIKSTGGDGTQLVQKWINSKIITGSYKNGEGIPYLEIGPNFYHLSGYDKRRVTQTLDAIYQVTTLSPHMYFIKDPATLKVIGTYSREGLTLE